MFIINPYLYDSTAYIVDDYSPTVAYSVRKLSSTATSAIRVRRASDNTEQDIGFSGDDLDTASLESFCSGTDGYVVTYYDQSGNSHDVTNSTTSNQPKIVSSGTTITRGSHAAPEFDGTDDFLEKRGVILNTSGISHFSVSNNDTSETAGVIMSQSWSDNKTIRIFNDRRTTDKGNLVVTNTVPTPFTADMSTYRDSVNQRLLSSFIDNGNNMSSFDNGATGGTDTWSGNTTNNAIRLGTQKNVTYLGGTIQEFIGFNTIQSSNRTDIEANINDYYSIY